MGNYYLEGDPSVDSTRRHLERVLNEPRKRRWPWLMAIVGGAALTFWRNRGKPLRQPSSGESR